MIETSKTKFTSIKTISYSNLTLFFLALGIILRIKQYLFNRPLWVDEAFIAFNVFNKPFSELLTNQLDFKQVAPFGFMFFQKLFCTILTNNELSLRLYPLFCGLFALYFFYKLCTLFLHKRATMFAVLLMSISSPLIYYSSEAKQYSSDVLFSILLIYFCNKLLLKIDKKSILLFTAVSVLSIWFSFTAAFVLPGVFIILILKTYNKKTDLMKISLICITSISSFIFYYFYYINNYVSGNDRLYEFWNWAFFSPYFDLDFFRTLIRNFQDLRYDIVGLAVAYFIIGSIINFKNNKEATATTLSPIIFTFLASTLQMYPFAGRLILFLIPFIIIHIASGISFSLTSKRALYKYWAIALLCLFMFSPVYFATKITIKPIQRSDIKSALKYIKTNIKKDDVIYIQYFSQFQYKYYAQDFGFNNDFELTKVWDNKLSPYKELKERRFLTKVGANKVFLGKVSKFTSTKKRFLKSELNLLKGESRVWFLFTHGVHLEAPPIIKHLDKFGKRIDEKTFKAFGFYNPEEDHFENAKVYLYDLSLNNSTKEKQKSINQSFFN